jgi:hypothetical protein
VYFNSATGEYNFWENPYACGEIGMVGDFNEWGGTGNYPLDVYLLRDPDIPSRFSLDYTFYDYTTLLFRLNADPTFTNVWGGNSLCQTGIQSTSFPIPVPAGTYHITFDFNSGDYCFTPISNSMTTAPKVFTMNIDGLLDEPEWVIDQHIMRLIEGVQGTDPNAASFGVSYNDSYLYVGLQVSDNYLAIGDIAEFFMDGDNSGGGYDDHDVHFSVDPGGNVVVITGPSGGIVIDAVAVMTGDGYTIEAAIPFESLDVIPVENNVAGFDIIVGDDDSGTGLEYRLSWSGTTNNATSTSEFGEVTLGTLNCGCVSLYNPNLGDIILRTPDFAPTNYLATYDLDDNYSMVFRQNRSNTVTWGSPDFPYGTAVLGGPEIPALQGRYRISFDCLSGVYSFEPAPAGNNVALADFTDDAPVIDGQLDEYDLAYDCDILVAGTGPVNNVVNWGARWDMESVYIGARVNDENLFGTGNPWDNDGIELYIDGNNDKDGPYDNNFDTQVIMHIFDQITPWFKADGVMITNYEYNWTTTDLGYNVEIRLGWDNFDFEPGSGRVIGWSLGNNDNDNNIGRDYQTVWYGTDMNWANTSVLGDLELANGPYMDIHESIARDEVLVYPNPTDGSVYVLLKGENLGENLNTNNNININVNDISGRLIASEHRTLNGKNNLISLNLDQASPGLYIVQIHSDQGASFTKKLIIR